MRVSCCVDCCNGGSIVSEVGVQQPEDVGGRSIVPKRGEGGTLTGGVSGSSSVTTLVVGSKNRTLVGVGGAIVLVWVVKGGIEMLKGVVVMVVDGTGRE